MKDIIQLVKSLENKRISLLIADEYSQGKVDRGELEEDSLKFHFVVCGVLQRPTPSEYEVRLSSGICISFEEKSILDCINDCVYLKVK